MGSIQPLVALKWERALQKDFLDDFSLTAIRTILLQAA